MSRRVHILIEGPSEVQGTVAQALEPLGKSPTAWTVALTPIDHTAATENERKSFAKANVVIFVARVTDGETFSQNLNRVHDYGLPVTVGIGIGGSSEVVTTLRNWCGNTGILFFPLSAEAAGASELPFLAPSIAAALLAADSAPRLCGIIPEASDAIPQEASRPLTVVVLGASGDLAKKKTFPALVRLFFDGLLRHARIVGYARSALERDKVRASVRPYVHADVSDDIVKAFFENVSFVAGSYSEAKDFERLNMALLANEHTNGGNRLFYLALPPTVFVGACTAIRQAAMAPLGWTRVIVEKPFGRDLSSSNELSSALGALLEERQIYRIDHYLGKEMVQNMVTLRFANKVFSSVWNCDNIASVQITFKETIGTQGRGGYFDTFGIIRDVIQNHLTQLFALVAMEKPRSLSAEHIRDEKVAVLQQVLPIHLEECVLGQYTAAPDGSMPGYLEDPTVPAGSTCPTFAAMVLRVRNDRWRNVPFIVKAGKALDGKSVTVRIQFHDEFVPFGDLTRRNELVIRAQPNEAMYLKITTKRPGTGNGVQQSELDLSYGERFSTRLPDAYESLIYEAIKGNTTNFVRSDELEAAWKIFTPLLHAIDVGKLKPTPYPAGSRGPPAADQMVESLGYVRSSEYRWSKV